MKRIFAWQTDTAGCFLYRIFWPLTNLPKDQFEVSWGAPGPDIFDYDIVIGQRIIGDNELWQKLCADPSVAAVYDLDDYLIGLDPDSELYGHFAPQAPGTERNIAAADLVTVSTPRLANRLRDLNKNTTVLPNCLPQEMIRHLSLPYVPVVGWAGSMFHGRDFDGIYEQIHAFKTRIPRAQVVTHGANYLGGLSDRNWGWTTMESYMASSDFNIGIAPLRRTPFNDMKSHCKLLEYAARGIPAVATAWGQYSDWITDGVNGFLVDDMDEWFDGLIALTDDQIRDEMGRSARQKAEIYTIERRIGLWVEAYQEWL